MFEPEPLWVGAGAVRAWYQAASWARLQTQRGGAAFVIAMLRLTPNHAGVSKTFNLHVCVKARLLGS